MENLTIEEENIKLKYLLRAAKSEIKKREDDLKPLNFKIGELQSYIDELEHNKKELHKKIGDTIIKLSEAEKTIRMYNNGNILTDRECKMKDSLKEKRREKRKESIKASFWRNVVYDVFGADKQKELEEELDVKLYKEKI